MLKLSAKLSKVSVRIRVSGFLSQLSFSNDESFVYALITWPHFFSVFRFFAKFLLTLSFIVFCLQRLCEVFAIKKLNNFILEVNAGIIFVSFFLIAIEYENVTAVVGSRTAKDNVHLQSLEVC